MGFRDTLSRMGEKSKARKELIRQMDEQLRMQKLVEDRQKPANERELERFEEEDRQERINTALERHRIKRRDDIAFNHNPIDTKNVVSHTEWEVLKEKNQFSKKSDMFSKNSFIHKNNPHLLKNNRSLMR